MNNILGLFVGILVLFIIIVLGVVAFGTRRLAEAEKSYQSARRSQIHRRSRRPRRQDVTSRRAS